MSYDFSSKKLRHRTVFLHHYKYFCKVKNLLISDRLVGANVQSACLRHLRHNGQVRLLWLSPVMWFEIIGGFRDTYLGRQVVSRPGGLRAEMGSSGDLVSAVSSPRLAESGAEFQPKSNLVPF